MIEQTPDREDRTFGGETGEALLVFDAASRLLLHADLAAHKLFGLKEHEATRAEELIAELGDLTPRRFKTRRVDGAGARDLVVRVEALGSGPFAHGSAVLVILRKAPPPGATENGTAAATTHRPVSKSTRAERLESLWSLVVRRGLGGADQVKSILREGVRDALSTRRQRPSRRVRR